MSKKCEISVDTSKGQAELEALEMQSEITAKGVMNTLNKSYMATQLFLDIFHVTIPYSLQLMVSASMMAGQMFADLATAYTVAGVLDPSMIARASFTFLAASMMFYRGMVLQQQASEIEESINSTIHFLDIMTRF